MKKLCITLALVLTIATISAVGVHPPGADAGWRCHPTYYYPPVTSSCQPSYVVYAAQPTQNEEPLQAANKKQKALIEVSIPANADLFIDDEPTKQKGIARKFSTPPLPAGDSFYYTLRAEMDINGTKATTIQRVSVKAGETSQVNFEFAPENIPEKKLPVVNEDVIKANIPAANPNVERKSVFTSLFNGKNLEGWINRNDAWKVSDDAMVTNKVGTVVYAKEFSHCLIKFEYKQDPDAVTVVLLHNVLSTEDKKPLRVFLTGDKFPGKIKTGSLVFPTKNQGRIDFGGNLQNKVKDDWNECQIDINDNKVQVSINGVKVPRQDTLKDFIIGTGRIAIHNVREGEISIRKIEVQKE